MGLAGAIVVATSLTGLREDHGQWGIDSLVLGVAPLGAWLLLTLAALPLAPPLVRTVRTRTDGASLNAALADTGRLLAIFSLLLSTGVLLS